MKRRDFRGWGIELDDDDFARALAAVGVLFAAPDGRPPYNTDATSIEKALDLLITLGELGGSAGLLALAEQAGVPKSSAHRLLQSLSSRGLVSRTSDGDYQLGSALVVLGELARRGDALLAASEPALR